MLIARWSVPTQTARRVMLHSNRKIKELETEGYVVEVQHFRRLYGPAGEMEPFTYVELSDPLEIREALSDGWKLHPSFGATLVDIFDADGNCLAVGTSRCNGTDQFNKTIGRDIALGRALKEANLC